MSGTKVSSGLVVVDKPAGLTSHDVVARLRRLAGTRRVGHAGTLDPMATGVLVVGVERATKLLGHLALADKAYDATIRLGQTTVTDDAEGEVTGGTSTAQVSEQVVRSALAGFVGEIDQVPSSVSAIKVGGRRSYARVRAGEQVELAARRVTVTRVDVLGLRRPAGELLDVDITVECGTGTYVRALARDLGARLGVGGHLIALRRTRVGPYDLARARTLEELTEMDDPVTLSLDDAVAAAFPRRDLDEQQAADIVHGRPVSTAGIVGTYGVFGTDGAVLALVTEGDGVARPVAVLRPA